MYNCNNGLPENCEDAQVYADDLIVYVTATIPQQNSELLNK